MIHVSATALAMFDGARLDFSTPWWLWLILGGVALTALTMLVVFVSTIVRIVKIERARRTAPPATNASLPAARTHRD